jgi:hypothetical protein
LLFDLRLINDSSISRDGCCCVEVISGTHDNLDS